MWMMTKQGFISVVRCHAPNEHQVAVRARRRDHLVAILDLVDFDHVGQETDGTDYRFRVFFTNEELGVVMMAVASAIDYGNFKGAVDGCYGPTDDYANSLHQVWSVMSTMQPHGPYGSKRGTFRDTAYPSWPPLPDEDIDDVVDEWDSNYSFVHVPNAKTLALSPTVKRRRGRRNKKASR